MAMHNKDFAEVMRKCAKDAYCTDTNGNIICSPELWEQIATIIENSEEVVRCEECEYATKGKNIFICNKEFYKCSGTSCKHNGGHYCSYGKRKESK